MYVYFRIFVCVKVWKLYHAHRISLSECDFHIRSEYTHLCTFSYLLSLSIYISIYENIVWWLGRSSHRRIQTGSFQFVGLCAHIFFYIRIYFSSFYLSFPLSPVFSLPLSCSYSLCLQFFVYANLMCLSFNTILSYRTQFYAKHTLSTSRLKTTKPKWNYA